jgi:hypothetical protein
MHPVFWVPVVLAEHLMPVPDYQTLLLPILKLAGGGQAETLIKAEEILADLAVEGVGNRRPHREPQCAYDSARDTLLRRQLVSPWD